MGERTNSRVMSVRLPVPVALRVARDAAVLGISVNEFILRRLTAATEHKEKPE